MTPQDAYAAALAGLGKGKARNIGQLQVWKWGFIAGHSEQDIRAALLQAWGEGRQPDERELDRAAQVGAAEAGKPYTPHAAPIARMPKPDPEQEKAIRRRAFSELCPGPMSFEALSETSPGPVNPWNERQQAAHLLLHLYGRQELVFCGTGNEWGEDQAAHVLPVETWAERFLCCEEPPPFFCINPLTGQPGPTADKHGQTYRGLSCIAARRFTMFEIDDKELTPELQAGFLYARICEGWPVRAITYSGGKSLHALVQVDATDAAHWKETVSDGLFSVWERLGADKACQNAMNLSRLPGHHRDGSDGPLQRLLWVNRCEITTTPQDAQGHAQEAFS